MSKTKKDLQMEELEMREQVATIIKDYALSGRGHRIPQTRREFMNSGLIAMTGTLLAPTLLQLVSSSAWGAECEGSALANSFPAFINIQLNGGPALFANYMARGNAGDGIDYSRLGMGASPGMEELFSNNAPFWMEPDAATPASGMIRAFIDAISRTGPDKDIYANTAFIAMSAESVDDRVTNPNDLSGMLAAAGVVGQNLPHMLTGYGAFLSETLEQPVNQFVGAVLPSANMLKVTTAASLENSLTFKGAIGAMSTSMRTQLLTNIEGLTKLQVEALASKPDSHESQKILKDLLTCATSKNKSVMNSATAVDLYNNFPKAGIAEVWAKNKTATDTNAQMIEKGLTVAVMNSVIERCGLVVANCVRGFSGGATINLGGYDYHAPFYNRASGTLKDRFLGDLLARVLKTAKLYGRKVFIQVSADGSVYTSPSNDATINWVNDFPKSGMNYIIAYDPAGPPASGEFKSGNYHDLSHQLNHFDPGGATFEGKVSLGVSTANPIASLDAQDLAAAAIFLNYLNFAKRPELIDSPALAKVKARLTGALPTGAGSIFDYFTRLK